jgi:thymidylate synthase
MNKLDKDYQELLQDILTNGVKKNDRTGTGTLSVFGRQIRHKMSDGKFPIITTKKMYFKGIVTELIWFLRGDTNIKYLVDNDCNIWTGDAYKNYCKHFMDEYLEKNELGEFYRNSLIPHPIEEFINKIKTDDEFAKKWGELGPIYGKQWRSWKFTDKFTNGEQIAYVNGKIDQIQNLINDLKTNPDSRRLMVSAWNPADLPNMVLPPCHYGFQVWTRELSDEERIKLLVKLENPKGYEGVKITDTVQELLTINNIPTRTISLMWNQRSIDTGLGLPYNITSYALLLTILGKMTNMIPEELIGNLGDTHIYSDHIDGLKEQLTREPYQLPTLKINSGNENWHLLELDEVLNTLDPSVTFKLENYQSHPTIKLPLSN